MQAFTSHPRHRVYMKGSKDGTMTAKKTYYNRRAISPIVFSDWIARWPEGGGGDGQADGRTAVRRGITGRAFTAAL